MSGAYCTPDGHAVTHAMQPRQRVEVPHERRRHRRTRPRARPSSGRCGRAASPSPRPRARRSGHVGRQKPQWTHCRSAASAGDPAVEGAARIVASTTVVTAASPRVQDAVRIERALDRATQRAAIARRSPDVDRRLQLAAPRRTTTLPNDRGDAAQPLDGRRLRLTSPSIREQPRADRGAANAARRSRRRAHAAIARALPAASPAASCTRTIAPGASQSRAPCSRHSVALGVAVDDLRTARPQHRARAPASTLRIEARRGRLERAASRAGTP